VLWITQEVLKDLVLLSHTSRDKQVRGIALKSAKTFYQLDGLAQEI
jgi:hypothetical protein